MGRGVKTRHPVIYWLWWILSLKIFLQASLLRFLTFWHWYHQKEPSDPMHKTYCKGPNDSAVPPFLVPAKMLRQMTFYLCRNPLVYPLTQEIRCIYHTELQGRLGHAFVRNFHQCSSLCNGLSDLMIPFNAFFMEFHRFSLIFVISFRFYVRTGVLSMGWNPSQLTCSILLWLSVYRLCDQ